jgi:hypothetical protein
MSLESAYRKEKKLILQNIRRASKGEYSIPKTDVEYAKAHLPAVNKLTDSQLKIALKMAQKIRISPIYTAKGQKKIAEQKRKTLQKHGVNIDSKAELDIFGEFMKDLKDFSLNRIYDSTKAAELWGEMREQGATPKEIKQAYKKWVKSKHHGGRRKNNRRN